MKLVLALLAFSASSAFAIGAYIGQIPSALTPAGNSFFTRHGSEQTAARIFADATLIDSRNAQTRARLLELVREQSEARAMHPLSRTDFTLVINEGLGWDDRLGPNTLSYVHDFVNDMRSLGVRVVFLQKNAYGPIRENGHVIASQLRAVLDEGRPVILLSLCKGTPELTVALQRCRPTSST